MRGDRGSAHPPTKNHCAGTVGRSHPGGRSCAGTVGGRTARGGRSAPGLWVGAPPERDAVRGRVRAAPRLRSRALDPRAGPPGAAARRPGWTASLLPGRPPRRALRPPPCPRSPALTPGAQTSSPGPGTWGVGGSRLAAPWPPPTDTPPRHSVLLGPPGTGARDRVLLPQGPPGRRHQTARLLSGLSTPRDARRRPAAPGPGVLDRPLALDGFLDGVLLKAPPAEKPTWLNSARRTPSTNCLKRGSSDSSAIPGD